MNRGPQNAICMAWGISQVGLRWVLGNMPQGAISETLVLQGLFPQFAMGDNNKLPGARVER